MSDNWKDRALNAEAEVDALRDFILVRAMSAKDYREFRMIPHYRAAMYLADEKAQENWQCGWCKGTGERLPVKVTLPQIADLTCLACGGTGKTREDRP